MGIALRRLMVIVLLLTSIATLTSAAALRSSQRSSYKPTTKRVEMRVYRGPVDHYTGSVPWGYFVRQPADHTQ
uniref:Secreted protein n=1 Tax=Anopheles dirus TaxID=7168 RepID=A0A182NHF0_9DIPT